MRTRSQERCPIATVTTRTIATAQRRQRSRQPCSQRSFCYGAEDKKFVTKIFSSKFCAIRFLESKNFKNIQLDNLARFV